LGGRTFEALDFDPSDKIDLFQNIKATRDNTTLFPLLTWNEPNGQVSADLEMFLLSSPTLPIGEGENVLAVSGDPTPTTMDDPIRKLGYSPNKDENLYLVIGRELNGAKAPEKVKWISNANGSDRTTQYEYVNSNGATGASTIYGPANLKETIAVGSADVNQDFSSGLAKIRNFSSKGGSPVLFDDMGNPQNIFEDRMKPDIIAPDGVSTTVAGLENFRGTSAAAPHVAGIVALMQQAAGGAAVLTSEQIKEILQDTAIPVDSVNQLVPAFGFPQVDLAVATAQEFASYQYDIC
jgi:Subtilase family